MIHTTPTNSTQPLVGSLPMPSAPNSRKRYCPATCARLAMTRMSAATIAQPPAQPVRGPNARAAQVNVVPQSGSALFSSLYPIDVSSIGMKASSATTGAPRPTTATMNPSVAARLYAGAVEATPMTTLDTRPSAPVLRPFSAVCSTIVVAPFAVAMRHPSLRDSYGFSTKCPQKRGIPWEQGSPTSEIAEQPQASV